MSINAMASGGQFSGNIHLLNVKSNVDNVECRVCNDVFGLQGDKVPRLLYCGHTVCHQCLTRLPMQEHAVAGTLSSAHSILCPFDRQPTHMGDSGVWGLKKNFALIELLEKLQSASSKPLLPWSDNSLEKEKQLSVACEENECHVAVLYCTVCETHLCSDCSQLTHSTRTLAKHRRVPLSEKPRELPRCTYHPAHLVEFVCMETDCQQAPLMCYICKDYGRHVKHKHALMETEAESVRASMVSAVQHIRSFSEEVMDWARKLGSVIQQIEGGYSLAQEPDGQTRTIQVNGTADEARCRVRQYFSDLQETLKRQEQTALTVVDTHVRERLGVLKQQQEDMAMLLSQVTAVCYQCENTLQQDDAKVVLAKHEVCSLLETVQKQQQQFADLPEQLHLDPVVPITFTKDNRVHIGPKMEMRVVTLGLDDSGKTSILFKLKQNEFVQTIPTIGFNVETVEYKNLKITIWDVGGQPKLRPLWKHYYFNTQALIYVVDSSNHTRMVEAFNELTKLLQEKELRDASLLIFANKQDVSPCMSIEEMTSQFNLFKLCCSRSWHIQACDAKSGAGLYDGLEWLSHQLVAAGV